jgi:hypothetical protein
MALIRVFLVAVTVGFELTSSDISPLCRAFLTRVHAGVDL